MIFAAGAGDCPGGFFALGLSRADLADPWPLSAACLRRLDGRKTTDRPGSVRRLPSNVEVAWFNNLAGRDDWRGVGGMIVVGRTLPAARPMEANAIAPTNRPASAMVDKAARQSR